MSEFTDPRDLGGDIAGPGGPYDEGGVVLDTRRAIVMDSLEVAMLDNPSDKRRIAAVLIEGRINRSQDRARLMVMTSADGLAALASECVALAGREGGEFRDEFQRRFEQRIKEMP